MMSEDNLENSVKCANFQLVKPRSHRTS